MVENEQFYNTLKHKNNMLGAIISFNMVVQAQNGFKSLNDWNYFKSLNYMIITLKWLN